MAGQPAIEENRLKNNSFSYYRTSYLVPRFQSWSGSQENTKSILEKKSSWETVKENQDLQKEKQKYMQGVCSDIFCASIDWEPYWGAKLSLSLNKFLILATMWTNANLKGTNKKSKSARDCYARGKGLITIGRKSNHGAAFARHFHGT